MSAIKALFRIEDDRRVVVFFPEIPYDNANIDRCEAFSSVEGFSGASIDYIRDTQPADLNSEKVKKVINYLTSNPGKMDIVPIKRISPKMHKTRIAAMRK